MSDMIFQLFREELEQLTKIKDICTNPQFQSSELMNHYIQMAALFERTLHSMMKMTKISDSQQAYLREIQQELEREITERIKAEKKLADSYKRYRRNQLLIDLAEGSCTFDEVTWNIAQQLTLSLPAVFQVYYLQLISWRGDPFNRASANVAEIQISIDMILDKLNLSSGVIVWSWREGIGILYPVAATLNKEQQMTIGHLLKKQATSGFPHVGIAVGAAGRPGGIDSFSRHCQQARAAVNLGHRLWPGQEVYHYSDGQAYQLLYPLGKDLDTKEFIEKMLGTLLQYDRENDTDLTATLKAILWSANLKVAAKELFLHHKTIVSRKKRIEAILGMSLDTFEIRFNLILALHLLQICN